MHTANRAHDDERTPLQAILHIATLLDSSHPPEQTSNKLAAKPSGLQKGMVPVTSTHTPPFARKAGVNVGGCGGLGQTLRKPLALCAALFGLQRSARVEPQTDAELSVLLYCSLRKCVENVSEMCRKCVGNVSEDPAPQPEMCRKCVGNVSGMCRELSLRWPPRETGLCRGGGGACMCSSLVWG